jgi:hypothetical protein
VAILNISKKCFKNEILVFKPESLVRAILDRGKKMFQKLYFDVQKLYFDVIFLCRVIPHFGPKCFINEIFMSKIF